MPGRKLGERVEVVLGEDGSTEVHIPPQILWECVECFGENRLDVSFTFRPPRFVARLRSAGETRILDTLNNWIPSDPAGNAGRV